MSVKRRLSSTGWVTAFGCWLKARFKNFGKKLHGERIGHILRKLRYPTISQVWLLASCSEGGGGGEVQSFMENHFRYTQTIIGNRFPNIQLAHWLDTLVSVHLKQTNSVNDTIKINPQWSAPILTWNKVSPRPMFSETVYLKSYLGTGEITEWLGMHTALAKAWAVPSI